jgi:hypothetical protein
MPTKTLGKSDHRREHHQRCRYHPQVAHAGADLVLEKQTQDANRDRPDDDVPTQPVISIAERGELPSLKKTPEPCLDDPHDVAGEIDQYR